MSYLFQVLEFLLFVTPRRPTYHDDDEDQLQQTLPSSFLFIGIDSEGESDL